MRNFMLCRDNKFEIYEHSISKLKMFEVYIMCKSLSDWDESRNLLDVIYD